MVSSMPKSGGGGGGTSAKPASFAHRPLGDRNAVRRAEMIDQDRQRRKLLRDDVQQGQRVAELVVEEDQRHRHVQVRAGFPHLHRGW